MEQSKVCRMSMLFEKMVSENASSKERCELKALYEEFIAEGRDIRLLAQDSKRKQASNRRVAH